MYTIIIKKDNREISRNYGDGFFQRNNIADAMIDMSETLAADYPKNWDEPGARNLKGERLEDGPPMYPTGSLRNEPREIPDEIVDKEET
jgi:hypothetical protein